MEYPSVTVVIPVYNEERYIGDCLASLGKLQYPKDKLEILVVDNGSTDNTLQIVSDFGIKSVIEPGVKVGGVRNFGAKITSSDIIVFLDSDCVVETDWLELGVEQLQKGFAAVGGQYLLRDQPAWIERYWVLNNSREHVHQYALVGGCIFIWRKIFTELNGFNETLNSGEDYELTERIKKSGGKVVIYPAISVIHLGYPQTIRVFMKRQYWHSADYVSNFPKTLKDKVFLLVLAYLLALIWFLVAFVQMNIQAASFGLLAILAIPSILTIKRIKREVSYNLKFVEILNIYAVDVIYLTARLIGVLTGLKRSMICLLTAKSENKVSRR